jgi:hypothetical protein
MSEEAMRQLETLISKLRRDADKLEEIFSGLSAEKKETCDVDYEPSYFNGHAPVYC